MATNARELLRRSDRLRTGETPYDSTGRDHAEGAAREGPRSARTEPRGPRAVWRPPRSRQEEAAHRCRDTKKKCFLGNTLAHVDNTFRYPLNVLLLHALAPLRHTSTSLPGRVVGRVAGDGRVSQAASQ